MDKHKKDYLTTCAATILTLGMVLGPQDQEVLSLAVANLCAEIFGLDDEEAKNLVVNKAMLMMVDALERINGLPTVDVAGMVMQ